MRVLHDCAFRGERSSDIFSLDGDKETRGDIEILLLLGDVKRLGSVGMMPSLDFGDGEGFGSVSQNALALASGSGGLLLSSCVSLAGSGWTTISKPGISSMLGDEESLDLESLICIK